MPIEGSKPLGEWGKLIPVTRFSHITQTNASSADGNAFHITTDIPETPMKLHDKFDAQGNYLGFDFDIK